VPGPQIRRCRTVIISALRRASLAERYKRGMTPVLRNEARTNTVTPLLLQKDIERCVVDANLAVVFDESELSKAIHEKTYAGSGCTNHLSQQLLPPTKLVVCNIDQFHD
jgi:hypothetical protein